MAMLPWYLNIEQLIGPKAEHYGDNTHDSASYSLAILLLRVGIVANTADDEHVHLRPGKGGEEVMDKRSNPMF
jgi:hypothetical protein